MDDDEEVEEEVASEEEEAAAALQIRDTVLRDILTSGFQHGTKVTPSALQLTSVFIHAFVAEAHHRAAAEARDSGDAEILDEHLEKILPQLLLDMGP
jgi:hypothetical protein